MSKSFKSAIPLSRRALLKTGLGCAVGAATPAWAGWNNWSGGQRCDDCSLAFPKTEAELIALIKQAERVRAVGGSHSFSPVVPTQGTLVSLELMSGLIDHDANANQATLWAGTRVAAAGPLLKAVNQALINEADINLQSLGGAVSTATHGTGKSLQSYSAYVKKMRLITATGEVLECSAEQEPEIFNAARVAVGSLGIISQLTLQNVPAYKLHEQVQVTNLASALDIIEKEKNQHRHIEFFAFPYGGKAIVKRLNETTDAVTPPLTPTIDENEILDLAANLSRVAPFLTGSIQHLVGAFVSDSSRVDDSYKIFPSPRTVGFNEMEYSVPAERGLECFQEVVDTIRNSDVKVFFPIEFRYVAKDDCWLSPFYERDSVSISIHQYYKQSYSEFFNLIEPIFWKYQGRPHWGKITSLKAEQFRQLYPRMADFLRIRQQLDPSAKFLNSYMKQALIG